MAAVEGIDAVIAKNDNETAAAAVVDHGQVDKPLAVTADETTAATTATEFIETSTNTDDPNPTSENDDTVKEEINAPKTTSPIDIEPTTETSPGDEEIQPPSDSDGILLSFGDANGGNAEVKNQNHQETTSSNDFDLLGVPPAKTTIPSPDVNGVLGEGIPLDNQATDKGNEATPDLSVSEPEPNNDFLGVSSGETTSNNAQQQCSEPDTTNLEPQNTPIEIDSEKDVGETSAAAESHDENYSPANEDAIAEKLGSTNQTENENTSASEQVDPTAENVEGVPVTAFGEVNLPANDAAKKQDSTIRESDGEENGVNPSEKENAVTENGGKSVVEEQAEGLGESTAVEPSTDQADAPKQTNSNYLAIDAAKQESTSESDDREKGVKPSEKENAVEANEGNTGVEEQVKGLGESTAVESTTDGSNAGEDTKPQEATDIDNVTPPPMPVNATSISENDLQNGEQANVEADGVAPAGHGANGHVEERTEEEEEWLSMGLGLGDALRQIVALTEEKDSALAICQETDNGKVQAEALLVDLQARLGAEMNQRAEYESEVRRVRDTVKAYEERLTVYEKMEDDLEKSQACLVQVVSEKSKIELEVQKLREMRDESEQKEVVLSNRLNDAKKKEANKSTAAGRFEADNENLRDSLQTTKDELENTSKAKAKLESNMEKLKTKAVERVKQAETALAEERELNEERKKKMKVFVETKAEELREAKDSANDLQKELEETRASLRSSRDRGEASQKELDAARLKHRELQRDMERMKRNSEQLHKMGNSLEHELEKSASETEEHKKKRMSAKHEIMQMVRTLEVERAVSSKLRESVKFTFTPKALSQQELLNECLRDFEMELEKLASKTGKSLEPSAGSTDQARDASADGSEASEINGASKKSKKSRASKADIDTERLISNLEQETQHVSKGIMQLSGSIERMRSLLNDDNMFGCMTYLSNILAVTGEAKHQRLGDSDAHEELNSDQFV